jgi:hypothetical protein
MAVCGVEVMLKQPRTEAIYQRQATTPSGDPWEPRNLWKSRHGSDGLKDCREQSPIFEFSQYRS